MSARAAEMTASASSETDEAGLAERALLLLIRADRLSLPSRAPSLFGPAPLFDFLFSVSRNLGLPMFSIEG